MREKKNYATSFSSALFLYLCKIEKMRKKQEKCSISTKKFFYGVFSIFSKKFQ
jgi:hypothetical protein